MKTSAITRKQSFSELFEPRTIERLIQEHVPLDWTEYGAIANARVERYWPNGQDGISLEWSFDVGNQGRHILYARTAYEKTSTTSPTDSEPSETATPKATLNGRMEGIRVMIPQLTLIVHSLDRDEQMPQLDSCLDRMAMSGRFRALKLENRLLAKTNDADLDCHLLAYRAGRRAAIRYGGDSDHTVVLGKTYRDDRGTRIIQRHTDLRAALQRQDGSRACVASPLGYDKDLRMVFLEWLVGWEVDEGSQSARRFLNSSVDAVVALHDAKLEGLTSFSIDDECAIVARWSKLMGNLDHRCSVALSELVMALLDQAMAIRGCPETTIHRDFYPKQIVVMENSVGILDLDTLAVGSPCVDIGNFLAHFVLLSLEQRLPSDTITSHIDYFMREYEVRRRIVDKNVLAFFFCSALIRLGMVHVMRPGTGAFAPALWKLARAQFLAGVFSTYGWECSLSEGKITGNHDA